MDRFHYRLPAEEDDYSYETTLRSTFLHYGKHAGPSSSFSLDWFMSSNMNHSMRPNVHPLSAGLRFDGGMAMAEQRESRLSFESCRPFCSGPSLLKDTPRTKHRKIVMASISTSTLSPKSYSTEPSTTQANAMMDGCQVLQYLSVQKNRGRIFPKAPERVLDAPDYVDDFYLKLIDWGACQLLAVALGASLYVWDPRSGQAQELFTIQRTVRNNECKNLYISSIKWIPSEDAVLAVGISDGRIELWDVSCSKKLRTIKHEFTRNNVESELKSSIVCPRRIAALSWNRNILCSGNRSGHLYYTDVRSSKPFFRKIIDAHQGQEICAVSWAPDGLQLASGGNDNTVNIFELRQRKSYLNKLTYLGGSASTLTKTTTVPIFSLKIHKAAVKALAWCPWKARTLATGGGTADQTIKIWNTATGALLSDTFCGSAVTGLLWSPSSARQEELLSTHGFADNQLAIWDAPSMTKLAELKAHTGRILAMTNSPDGSTIVTAGADENLHFWQIYGDLNAPSTCASSTITITKQENSSQLASIFENSISEQPKSPLPMTPRISKMSPLSVHQLNSPVLSPHQKPSPASIQNIYLNMSTLPGLDVEKTANTDSDEIKYYSPALPLKSPTMRRLSLLSTFTSFE